MRTPKLIPSASVVGLIVSVDSLSDGVNVLFGFVETVVSFLRASAPFMKNSSETFHQAMTHCASIFKMCMNMKRAIQELPRIQSILI